MDARHVFCQIVFVKPPLCHCITTALQIWLKVKFSLAVFSSWRAFGKGGK